MKNKAALIILLSLILTLFALSSLYAEDYVFNVPVNIAHMPDWPGGGGGTPAFRVTCRVFDRRGMIGSKMKVQRITGATYRGTITVQVNGKVGTRKGNRYSCILEDCRMFRPVGGFCESLTGRVPPGSVISVSGPIKGNVLKSGF